MRLGSTAAGDPVQRMRRTDPVLAANASFPALSQYRLPSGPTAKSTANIMPVDQSDAFGCPGTLGAALHVVPLFVYRRRPLS